MNNNLWIDTCIVYEPGKKLAEAYNRKMESTIAQWVLFIDQDLFFCCPRWYDMCLNAIRKVGNEAGWITAKCNRIGNKFQHFPPPEDNDDIIYHIEIAKQLYKEHGNTLVEVTKSNFSGFFILTPKSVWSRVGGFKNQGSGLGGIDLDYCKRIKTIGCKLYVMPGLYFYHLYKTKWGKNGVWNLKNW